jgi:hypothetical protein
MENKVILLDYMGSDNHHALAAWSSTFLELDLEMPDDIHMRVDTIVEYILQNSNRIRDVEGLLKFLADNHHNSPFRFSVFNFGITLDLASHIHKLKHAVLLLAENAESARYKELKEDKFYLPEDWKDYGDIGNEWYNRLQYTSMDTNDLYHNCLRDLIGAGMSKKRAKETARYFKMYNSQLNTTNLLSFDGVMQMYHKRHDKSFVQNEIANIVIDMVNCIRDIPNNPFQHSLKAFGL